MIETKPLIASICWQLGIGDPRHIEIEAKRRVLPEDAKALKKYLLRQKGVRHQKQVTFFDQFLDTPNFDLLRMGASMRLRYKGDGSRVYLQYKGPGFLKAGLLYRSEFCSDMLARVVKEESHHDIVQFSDTSVREILHSHVSPAMAEAIRRHLGNNIIDNINRGHILCSYQKDKFEVDLGKGAVLEPSLDHLSAFHINQFGLHSLSTFWEYENEIKAEGDDLKIKLDFLPKLLKFDAKLTKKFELKAERLDKYHRCASCFLSLPKHHKTERQPSPHRLLPRPGRASLALN